MYALSSVPLDRILMHTGKGGKYMSKIRNVKYQFKYCIDSHFREGMDKHSLKAQGKNNGTIYSYSDRKNLIDLSSNCANWLKINYPEIKQIKDISSNHIQEFLNTKIDICSQKTLEQYQSRFRKIEVLAISTYHIDVDFHSAVTPLSNRNGGGKVRNAMLSTDNYNKLLKSTNANFRKSLILSFHFGLRAAECAKLRYEDISANGIKIIDSKGKRNRFIPAENIQQKKIIEDFLNKTGRVCPIQTGSLQQAFNREKKKQGINISNGDFHTSRKAFATSKYKEYREQGQTVQQALDTVSHCLGHGNNRNELMKQYICCPIK